MFELIPESLRGIMTGAWGMNICIGGLLASSIANKFILPSININGLTEVSRIQLAQTFFGFSIFLIVFAIAIRPKYKRIFTNKFKHAYENH